MNTIIYETKVDSRAGRRRRFFAAVEELNTISQQCLCYCVPEDTRGKLHSSWRRPLRTSNLNQDDQIFNQVLKIISLHSTTKKNTVMIDSLSVDERLTLTLRFLFTGRAFECIKFSGTISPSANSQAVIEKCVALMLSRIT